MHFPFSEIEVVWTLTFAALLVLLVVLLGRDRVRRYPFFTASVVLTALEMLMRRLLALKLAPLTAAQLFFALGDAGVLITLLVVIELGRRAFAGASRPAWLVGAAVVLAASGAAVAWWGPWPARQTLEAHSLIAHLHLMQLFAEKGDLFNNLAFLALTLIAVFTGRRFHAGWRSHARQLLLGFSVAALVQVALRLAWQRLSSAPQPHTQAEFDHRIALQSRLLDANSLVYLAVLIGWIASLWFDDPGYAQAVNPASPEDALPAKSGALNSGFAEKADPIAAALQRALGADAGPAAKLDAGKPPSAR